jgi:hypothetical protein
MSILDNFIIAATDDDSELVKQLAQLGIKPLSDLSEKAQLQKVRRWEEDLRQGVRKKKNKNGS